MKRIVRKKNKNGTDSYRNITTVFFFFVKANRFNIRTIAVKNEDDLLTAEKTNGK